MQIQEYLENRINVVRYRQQDVDSFSIKIMCWYLSLVWLDQSLFTPVFETSLLIPPKNVICAHPLIGFRLCLIANRVEEWNMALTTCNKIAD